MQTPLSDRYHPSWWLALSLVCFLCFNQSGFLSKPPPLRTPYGAAQWHSCTRGCRNMMPVKLHSWELNAVPYNPSTCIESRPHMQSAQVAHRGGVFSILCTGAEPRQQSIATSTGSE